MQQAGFVCTHPLCVQAEQFYIDPDGYHITDQFAHRGFLPVGDITQAPLRQRIVDVLQISFHHIPAFVGNSLRFMYWAFLLIPATIGLLVNVCCKNQRLEDICFTAFRCCRKNLGFMAHNLKMVTKHAFGATPFASTIVINIYNAFYSRRVENEDSFELDIRRADYPYLS